MNDKPDDTSADPLLVTFLRDRDAYCPLCKYNLRALTSPRCPECGQALSLAVGLAEPYLSAWITLAGALAASAGVGLFFGTLFVLGNRPSPSVSLEQLVLFVFDLYFVATIPLAVCTVIFRRRFLRLNRTVQWGLAVSAAFLSGACFAAFMTTQ